MAAAAEEGLTAAQSLQQALPDLVRAFTRPLKHSKITEEDALVKIKRCVKQGGETAAREAEYYIARELEQPAAAVKMRCLQLLDVLFQRSKLFRQAVAADCRGVFGCVLPEVSKSLKVKGTQEELSALRNLGLQLLAQWDASHGAHLPELHALCRFLSEVHHVQLDAAEVDRARAAELDRLLAARTNRVIKELEEQATAIEDNLNEIDEAFNVLFPRIVDETPAEAAAVVATKTGKTGEDNVHDEDEDEDDEYENIAWESADEVDHPPPTSAAATAGFADSGGYSTHDTMAILGIHNMNFTLTISLGQAERLHGEESGGDDLLNHLKDCLRALRRHHIQRVAEWKVTLTRYSARPAEQQGDDAGVFDRTLREPVQRWLGWIEGITARINDVQQRCSDISHDRKQQEQQQQQTGRKRPAEFATEDSGDSLKALRSETV